MTDIKQAGLIEKIKKLFAMAQKGTNNDGSSNEQEASMAMAKAQELLAKYNLDIRTIQDSTANDAAGVAGTGKREQVKVSRSAMYKWQQQLWHVIAEVNFCFHWIVETQEPRYNRVVRCKRHVILGSEANVIVAQMMGEYIMETIERSIPYTGSERLSNSAVSWREGCAVRLIDRLREKAARMKKEGFSTDGANCTGLAVQDLHEKEYAANYDARYGIGSYARMKQSQAEYAAKSAQRAQDEAKRRKQEEEERARTLTGETPVQRAQRERQESKEAGKRAAANARAWERYQRKQEREAARRDLSAYARGFKKANEINLDSQLNNSKKKAGLL